MITTHARGSNRPSPESRWRGLTAAAPVALAVAALMQGGPAVADHIGAHATPCNAVDTVGGGNLGVSPGPVGAPDSLGWDVGSGQCNGSFTVTADPAFPGGQLELGLRAEQRRIGQVARLGADDYEVELGPDLGPPAAPNRAWWNFQGSIAYGGDIDDLDALTLKITTDVGPNQPAAAVVDLLAIRALLDARNANPNPTSGFADLFQFSQNPEFGWFSAAPDTDGNPTGKFDYSKAGAWRFTLTATEGGVSKSVSACIHTPGEKCAPLNASPVCTGATPTTALLWPPNHAFTPVSINGVTDADGDTVIVNIDAIHQDEAVKGPGKKHPDALGVGTSVAQLRAERDAKGDGRVYHVAFTASDGKGGSCQGSVKVGVPRDQSANGGPVDGGPLFDSTVE